MIAKLRQTFLRLADATSITRKIMGIVLGLSVFFGLGFTIYLHTATQLLLTRQLESRGLTIAQGVATQATEPVLMGNEFILHSLLEETRQVNPDVRYVLVVSQQSEVLGDTFRRRIPVGLVTANIVSASGEPRVVPILTEEGMIRDVAYPLFGGRGGVVRVGMSEQFLQAELNRQTMQLLLATMAISLLGIWFSFQFSHILARPIKALAAATQQVAGGDLSGKAPVFARDDIGQLAMAFNAMTDRLGSQYEEIRRFSQQVLRDNAELVALNGVTASLNRLYHIDSLPSLAARLIAHRLELDSADVLLWQPDRECWLPEPASAVRELAAEAIRVQGVVVAGTQAAVPLMAGERCVGALVVSADSDRLASERCCHFLQSVGNHLTVALENARLVSELTDKQQVLTHLFDRAVAAQEEERRRISRELHDETSQSLTSLMLGLRSVEEATSPDVLRQNVRELRRRLTMTLDAVHQMARRLRPLALDDLGLKAALSRHIQEQAAQTGLDIDLDMDGLGEERLPADIETAVYRVVQEALANAIQHAAATEISVVLERQHGTVIALVEDNGSGFDVAAATRGSARLGLSGMQERARLVGGTLTFESAFGVGTTVCLRVPSAAREGGTPDAHSHSAG
ncbi:MAG TPA: ATP-binding protein [Symbiobacteriaceae bacterium]|jgi:signal transduction histidine kinase